MTGRGNLGQIDRPAAEQKGTLLHYIKQPKLAGSQLTRHGHS